MKTYFFIGLTTLKISLISPVVQFTALQIIRFIYRHTGVYRQYGMKGRFYNDEYLPHICRRMHNGLIKNVGNINAWKKRLVIEACTSKAGNKRKWILPNVRIYRGNICQQLINIDVNTYFLFACSKV